MSSPIRGKQFLITGAAGSVLALSPVFAQSAGNDPLLDGMLSPSPTATPAATPNAPQPTNVPARRIDSDSTKLLTEQEGIKELNKLAFSENAYEGQKLPKYPFTTSTRKKRWMPTACATWSPCVRA